MTGTNTNTAVLEVFEPRQAGDRVEIGAVLTTPRLGTKRLWFALDERHDAAVSPWADPFVLACLFPVMDEGIALEVHGAPVSPSLVANVHEFQRAWHAWLGVPVVEIRSDDEQERAGRAVPVAAAFSGGVDSAYTVFCHRPGETSHAVEAAVMVHGFDVPLADEAGFAQARTRAHVMLDSIGVELVGVATNVRELLPDWERGHGTAVAAALTVLAGRFGSGLIAASGPYDPLILPWGSNPLTDPMLGSDTFRIVHDGAGCSRGEKIEALGEWPSALGALRFCWSGPRAGANCGRCNKCIHTELLFRCARIEHELFENRPGERDVLRVVRVPQTGPFTRLVRREIVERARREGIEERWARVLRRTVRLEALGAAAPMWMRDRGRGALRAISRRPAR